MAPIEMTSVSRRLPTDADVLLACIQRIAGVPIDRLASELRAVAGLLSSAGVPPLAEDDPATDVVMNAIRRPGDRRSVWGQLMALVAVLSSQRGDTAGFWRAGHEVLMLQDQIASGKKRRRDNDALNAWIDAYLTEHAGADTTQVISGLVESVGVCPEFEDFDPADGVLTYQPRDDSEKLKDITMPAIRRRIQRARQQPASVA